MKSQNKASISQIFFQIIGAVIAMSLLAAIHQKFDIPVPIFVSPILSIITGYIFYAGYKKFKLRHKGILAWMTLGFFFFFCYSTIQYLQVGVVNYSAWHIIAIIFPVFFVGNVANHTDKDLNN